MSSYKEVKNYGNIYWYKDGTRILHREDGPAIEYINGDKHWYYEGKLHREDGPAVDDLNYKLWIFRGKHLNCSSTEEFKRLFKLKVFW